MLVVMRLGTSKRWPINFYTQYYEQQHEWQNHALKIPECDTNFNGNSLKNMGEKKTYNWNGCTPFWNTIAAFLCSFENKILLFLYCMGKCDVYSSEAGIEKSDSLEKCDHVCDTWIGIH